MISSITGASFNEIFEENHPPTCAAFRRLPPVSFCLLLWHRFTIQKIVLCDRFIDIIPSKISLEDSNIWIFCSLTTNNLFRAHLRMLHSLNIVSPQIQGCYLKTRVTTIKYYTYQFIHVSKTIGFQFIISINMPCSVCFLRSSPPSGSIAFTITRTFSAAISHASLVHWPVINTATTGANFLLHKC